MRKNHTEISGEPGPEFVELGRLALAKKNRDARTDWEGELAQFRAGLAAWPVLDVPLRDFADSDTNSRLVTPQRRADIARMARSLKAEGQLQEVVGYRGLEGKVHLCFGFTRLAAAREAGLAALRTRVCPAVLSAAEIEHVRTIENHLRNQLTGAELALQAKRLVDAYSLAGGMDAAIERAAETLAVKPEQVRNLLIIVERLGGKVRDLLGQGKVNLAQARELAKFGPTHVQEDYAKQIAEALEVRNGGYGARIVPASEVAGWVANEKRSLAVVPWKLDVAMATRVAGCETCAGCRFNTATDLALFETSRDEAEKGCCVNPAGFEAKQALFQKAAEKAVGDLRKQVAAKKLEKESAASTAAIAGVAAPFAKEASLQRLVKKELGIGPAKAPAKSGAAAGKPGKGPTDLERWGAAYRAWAAKVSAALVKHVAADPRRKLAALLAGLSDLAWPEFDVADYELQKATKPPVEKPIGPELEQRLASVQAVTEGLGFPAGMGHVMGRLPWPPNVWEVEALLELQNMGPETIARVCRMLGMESPWEAAPELPGKTEGGEKDKADKSQKAQKEHEQKSGPKRDGSSESELGVCRTCGCTNEEGCEGGCSWVNAEQTLCSRCVPERAPVVKGMTTWADLQIPADVASAALIALGNLASGFVGEVLWVKRVHPFFCLETHSGKEAFQFSEGGESFAVLRRLVPLDRWSGGPVQKPTGKKKELLDPTGLRVEDPDGIHWVVGAEAIAVRIAGEAAEAAPAWPGKTEGGKKDKAEAKPGGAVKQDEQGIPDTTECVALGANAFGVLPAVIKFGVDLPKSWRVGIGVRLGRDLGGRFYLGHEFTRADGGSSAPPSVAGPGYVTLSEALAAAGKEAEEWLRAGSGLTGKKLEDALTAVKCACQKAHDTYDEGD